MSEARTIEDILREPSSTAEIQRAIDALDRRDASLRVKIHVLRNFTVESALPALRFAGYRRDLRVDATVSDFDTYQQDSLEPPAALTSADALLVWLWLEAMPMAFDRSGHLDLEGARSEIFGLLDRLSQRTTKTIYVHTFVPPLGAGPAWSGHDTLDALNLALRERARSDRRIRVVDVARLANDLGRSAAIDTRFALMSSAPVSTALARAWGESLASMLAIGAGRTKKVLVVDADDTLWGGIVGEDGAKGIRLSKERYPGKAHWTFQKQLLALRDRGVLLALASKNEPESVYEVFDRHPDCLLKREHFSAIRVGWGRKSDSIRSIATELGLGVDAFVFVDDSAVECAEVATTLPSVEVVQMPKEAALVPHVLAGIRSFDARKTTDEDRLRADHYAAEQAREASKSSHADLDAFLASLELEATMGPPTADEIERVAQLTQRTNQFNVTTLRYEAADIERMLASDRFVVMALRARDRFGDYGLTGVAIAEIGPDGLEARIDSLLMSCRTLGRRLEDALFAELVNAIAARGSCAIRAEYRPTAKNAQVASFFDARGFARVASPEGAPEGAHHYLRAADHAPPLTPPFIRIRRSP